MYIYILHIYASRTRAFSLGRVYVPMRAWNQRLKRVAYITGYLALCVSCTVAAPRPMGRDPARVHDRPAGVYIYIRVS